MIYVIMSFLKLHISLEKCSEKMKIPSSFKHFLNPSLRGYQKRCNYLTDFKNCFRQEQILCHSGSVRMSLLVWFGFLVLALRKLDNLRLCFVIGTS